jgi:hypothetical protein
VVAPAKIPASRWPGGMGHRPRAARCGMELVEVKWGRGGSPLKQFTMLHGRARGALVGEDGEVGEVLPVAVVLGEVETGPEGG